MHIKDLSMEEIHDIALTMNRAIVNQYALHHSWTAEDQIYIQNMKLLNEYQINEGLI